MDNSIEINGILFTLLCKSVADNLVYEIQKTRKYEYDRHREAGRLNIRNLRDIVKFTSRSIISRSSEDEKILYGYRSTSELGIWRLGYLEPKRCDLNKFSLDYVQGTLLHHLLQGLINNKFNELPFIPGDESGTNLLLDGAYNKTYFEENGLSETDRQQPEFLKVHKFILLPFPRVEDTSFIDNLERKIQLEPFSGISIKCDTKIEESDITSDLSKLSDRILSDYTLDVESNQHIVTYPFQEPNENIWNCIISIFTVNLINRVSPENNVILVYCKYQLEYSPEHIPVSGCYGIALLKSDKSSVNKYGLYESFIDSGIYICKPVVYTSVCVVAEEELEKRRCSKRYVYVGDRYDHVFPYGELYHMLTTGGLRKPRFKRKSKKSKKIKKYRFSQKSRFLRKSRVIRKSKK